MSERNPFAQRNDGGWCECSVCGRRFGGLTGFDAHRIPLRGTPEPEWRCATDAEIEGKGYHRDARGWWKADGVRPDAREAVLAGTAAPGAA